MKAAAWDHCCLCGCALPGKRCRPRSSSVLACSHRGARAGQRARRSEHSAALPSTSSRQLQGRKALLAAPANFQLQSTSGGLLKMQAKKSCPAGQAGSDFVSCFLFLLARSSVAPMGAGSLTQLRLQAWCCLHCFTWKTPGCTCAPPAATHREPAKLPSSTSRQQEPAGASRQQKPAGSLSFDDFLCCGHCVGCTCMKQVLSGWVATERQRFHKAAPAWWASGAAERPVRLSRAPVLRGPGALLTA